MQTSDPLQSTSTTIRETVVALVGSRNDENRKTKSKVHSQLYSSLLTFSASRRNKRATLRLSANRPILALPPGNQSYKILMLAKTMTQSQYLSHHPTPHATRNSSRSSARQSSPVQSTTGALNGFGKWALPPSSTERMMSLGREFIQPQQYPCTIPSLIQIKVKTDEVTRQL